MTTISMNNTQAPYYCVNPITKVPCTNNSECCQSGYEFDTNVQQCLCKYLFFLYKISNIFLIIGLQFDQFVMHFYVVRIILV